MIITTPKGSLCTFCGEKFFYGASPHRCKKGTEE